MINSFFQKVEELLGLLVGTDIFWSIVGVLFVILVLTLFVFIVRYRLRPICISRNDGGNLEISKSALVKAIETICTSRELKYIPKVKIHLKKGHIFVVLKIKLAADAQLETLTMNLQLTIREFLKKQLGLKEIGGIDIEVIHMNMKSEVKEISH